MKIQLTIGDIIRTYQAISTLHGEVIKDKAILLDLWMNRDALASIVGVFDSIRIEEAKKYADKDEKGNPKQNPDRSFVINPENMKLFQNSLIELLTKKEEIELRLIDLNKLIVDIPAMSMDMLDGLKPIIAKEATLKVIEMPNK